MSTLIPTWKRTARNDCSNSSSSSLFSNVELQRSVRRRISSSLKPSEKLFASAAPYENHGCKEKTEQSLATPLTEFADSGINNQQAVQNAEADVEDQQESLSVLKCHYVEGAAGDGVGDDISSNTRGRRYNRISMIIIYGREALCILALILTTYASIQNSPPRISKAPPPAPFFTRGSLVQDWPSGVLGPTQTRVSQSELSFVFYYAPWCAESQHARSVYEHVARLYYREAHFAAINCWQPGGECRLQYSKVQSWPVLMAYQPNGLAVQYHQAWTNAALSRFIKSVINPIYRLTDPEDLMSLMTGKDAVLVGFLDVDFARKQYNRFYQTSLKWLERDPFQEVAFAVVTGEGSSAFGVEDLPTYRLYLWNETLEFTGNDSWTRAELTGWVNKHLQIVSMWIAPPGATKSSSLAPYFSHGPVFFFFTPRALYGETSDAYMMLRQLGMQYYNCHNDIWVEEMAIKYIAEQRRSNAESYTKFKSECEKLLTRHPSQEEDSNDDKQQACRASSKSAIAISFVNLLNSSKFVEGKQKLPPLGQKQNDYCEVERVKCDEKFYECGRLQESDAESHVRDGRCQQAKMRHSSIFGSEKYETSNSKTKTSYLDSDLDYRGPKILEKQNVRRRCELLQLSEIDNSEIFFNESNTDDDLYVSLIKGMSCKHNRTLTFLGMDSSLYHAFAERLGVDVLNERMQSVAVIVDPEDESSYLLRESINLSSMAKLVHDYHNRTYSRFLRSSSLSFKNTHSFNMSEFRKESRRMVEIKRSELQATDHKNAKVKSDGDKEYYPTVHNIGVKHHEHHAVREINSHNFNHVVINSNKTVVVHFYSAQCAFCSVLSHHLLTISRLLHRQPSLDFVRFDGDKNDLRWEYNMDVFPTLIIFPNQRKSESRIFSRELQITVPNVLGFILSNLSPPERIHANYLVCESIKHQSTSRDDCLLALKRELSDSVSLNLRFYRKIMNRPARAARILDRLQLLQQFYLTTLRCLSHSCDFNLLKSNATSVLKTWQLGV